MNAFLSILKKVGRVSETVGKDVLEVGAVASPFLPIPAPVATAIKVAASSVEISPLHDLLMISGNVVNSQLGDTMNPLEQFAITIVLGVLNTVIKNPAHKAALQSQLLGVADDIYETYGVTPPPRPTATA